MPDGIGALQELGFDISAIGGQPFKGIRFVSSGLFSEATFPYGTAMGVRRTNLHQAMVQHAEAAGVRFDWQAVVTGIRDDSVIVNGQSIGARWIVGADGGQSRVRRWSGLDRHICKKQRYAFRRHYKVAPWADCMELHWGPGCQLYVTPVGREEICVALISRDPRLRLDEALSSFPRIAALLEGKEHNSIQRGAISVTRKLARVYSGNVALIGDASGGVDAITGEGLCLAFRQALLLADSLASGDLSQYQNGHGGLARRPALMARLMLLLEHSRIRNRVMRCFASKPELFANMLAAHIGSTSPVEAAANGLALGWQLLTA